jgi:hypothetical protein
MLVFEMRGGRRPRKTQGPPYLHPASGFARAFGVGIYWRRDAHVAFRVLVTLSERIDPRDEGVTSPITIGNLQATLGIITPP